MNFRIVAAVLAVIVFPAHAFADGDVEAGEKVYKKCKACHTADAETNKVGPHLVGIIGRTAASVADYKYSSAMKAKGDEGLVWDEANLTTYIQKPKDFVPGTKMTFPGLNKPEDIANLLAYLKSLAQ